MQNWTNWNDIVLTVDDFNVDDTVMYVPRHKQGNFTESDLHHGVVTSKNNRFVFVRFEDKKRSEACYPNDLRLSL